MKVSILAAVAAAMLGLAVARGQGAPVEGNPAKEALRAKLKDANAAAGWIYDDLPAGFAQAKKAGKPMLVVFR